MAAFIDNCGFVPTAGGTADWTYASTVGGYQSPAQANAITGTNYVVRAQSSDLTQWEYALGAYTASTGVFARTTVLYNSAGTGTKQGGAGPKINFSSVPSLVAVVALAEDLISIEAANSFTDAQKAQALANLGIPFQCGRLLYSNATTLTFKPYNGDLIKINGSVYRIPYAGIAGLANTGAFVNGTASQNLSANTLYYVYAFNNAGTLTADFSTTGHQISGSAGNVGVESRNGDDTRALIGMVYTNSSSQFSDALTATWFNRRQRSFVSASSSPGSPGGYFLEVGGGSSLASPGLRVYFLVWLDENSVSVGATADITVTANSNVGVQVAVDGTQVSSGNIPLFTNGNNNMGVSYGIAAGLAEGLHYAVLFGGANAGSVAYNLAQSYVTVRN
jgi:hypothetical protein